MAFSKFAKVGKVSQSEDVSDEDFEMATQIAANAAVPEVATSTEKLIDENDWETLAEALSSETPPVGKALVPDEKVETPSGIEAAMMDVVPGQSANAGVDSAAAKAAEAEAEAQVDAGGVTGAAGEGSAGTTSEDRMNLDPTFQNNFNTDEANQNYESLLEKDEVLEDLFRVGANDGVVAGMAANFHAYRKDCARRLKMMDQETRRRMAADANKEAAQQAAAGALSSLIGSMVNAGKRKKDIEGPQNIINEFEGKKLEFRDRVSSYLSQDLVKKQAEVYGNGVEMAAAIHEYNNAVLSSDAAQPFQEKMKAYAEANGLGLDEVASSLGKGDAPQNLMQEFEAVKDGIYADERVKKAKQVMEDAQKEFVTSMESTVKKMEALTNAGDPRPAENHKKMMEAIDNMVEKLPNPIEEEAKKEEFKKRLKETMESIKNSITAIMSRFTGGAAPAA